MTKLTPDYTQLWALEDRLTDDESAALNDRSVPAEVSQAYFRLVRAAKTLPEFAATLDGACAMSKETLAFGLLKAATAARNLASTLVPGCEAPEDDTPWRSLDDLMARRAILKQMLAMTDPNSPEYEPEFVEAEREHRRNAALDAERGTEKP